MTAAQVTQKLQELLDALTLVVARQLATEAVQGALAGGIGLPAIRRDAQNVDHPELIETLGEAYVWANQGLEMLSDPG